MIGGVRGENGDIAYRLRVSNPTTVIDACSCRFFGVEIVVSVMLIVEVVYSKPFSIPGSSYS